MRAELRAGDQARRLREARRAARARASLAATLVERRHRADRERAVGARGARRAARSTPASETTTLGREELVLHVRQEVGAAGDDHRRRARPRAAARPPRRRCAAVASSKLRAGAASALPRRTGAPPSVARSRSSRSAASTLPGVNGRCLSRMPTASKTALRERRERRVQRPLAGLLRAVRALGVDALDDQRVATRACRRRSGCGSRAATGRACRPKRLTSCSSSSASASAHVGRALHLARDEHRVERAAAVVRDPDVVAR